MAKHWFSEEKRTVAVNVKLSLDEVAAVEKLMVQHGFRRRSAVLRWAMLLAAGEKRAARLAIPMAAQARAREQRAARKREREAATAAASTESTQEDDE